MGEIGLYLHVPFCLSKCAYCDFSSEALSAAGGLSAARRYLDAVLVELDLRAAGAEFGGASIGTVYVGGGTPTVLPAEWVADMLERIGDRFAVVEGAEVTVEANPGTVDEEKLAGLVAAGVNRMSLGVQSLSDGVLATLGRAHSAEEAEKAIASVRAAGCGNLSVDLIYGVPGQSPDDWRETVERTIAVGPEHVSCYGLSVEPGTRLAADIEEGRLEAPDEDRYAEMYAHGAAALTAAGYDHYEISNFALPGRECRHNRGYWASSEYLGLGVSAHSYRGGMRWNNVGEQRVYTEWMEAGVVPVARAEALSARARVGEMLILGLRRAEGASETEIAERCGTGPREVFGDEVEQLCEDGLLVCEGDRIRLPREMWLVSNEVLSHFVD